MVMEKCLPTLDIYQVKVATKSHTYFWCLDFFQKTVSLISGLKSTLSKVTSFLLDILSGLQKKLYSGLKCNL